MARRGQVTLFIILAIVIAAISLIIFFVVKERQKIALEQQAKIQEIRAFIRDCLTDALNQTEKDICFNGFYYKAYNNSILYFLTAVPYFYKNKTIAIPKLEQIENEFSQTLIENIGKCLNNFSQFETEGIDVLWNYSLNTKIKEGSIAIMTSPIAIKKDNFITSFSLSLEKKSELDHLYLALKEIIEGYNNEQGFLCIDCLDDISTKYNVTIQINSLFTPTGEGAYIVRIIKEDLSLRFAMEV
ncbi:MAG: hypothetical protein ACPLXC_01445 [Candidatus Pacearchaeota archaeon]